ncbi:AAA family ATPase [Paenibacillus sp. 11B]|uniref:ATP-dependent nuclease n=1 Tax=Paenibacillus sp. 11B TaxID=3060965 RepID=UPI00265645B6|nr:AAA family ATPase [Paenibacillus sp. 11B]MDN8593137.1 AAA family ATPase [Paenibacillus sp. 11B]
MYIKELRIWNFRKYGVIDAEEILPGTTLHFHPTFNLLIGENDSGKTAIIDAIKLTLGTTSDDNLRITDEDFFVSKDGVSATELKIECFLSGLTKEEAGIFFEWLTFDLDGNYELQVRLVAKKQPAEAGIAERIDKYIKAGPEISSSRLEGLAREILRTTYLKPLRNAEIELQPGVRSRLAQILRNHPAFFNKDRSTKHELEITFEEANKQVEAFFVKPYSDDDNKTIQIQLKQYLTEFFNKPVGDEPEPKSMFKITSVKLNEILRRLSLLLEEVPSGLGSLNLLFIAAELLLHDDDLAIGPNLTLIEEIEAHLHPQAQLRLIKYLQEKVANESESVGNQFILTTHSPTLAASTQLKHVILLYDGIAYPMGSEHTDLNTDDYEFLERFMDATKSNLFFAKGVVFVEGDAENLLLPTIANLIDRPLHKFGVSIVNIGNTAFKRYVSIYSRSKSWLEQYPDAKMMMPVSVVTDLDVRPLAYYEDKKRKSDEAPTLRDIYIINEDNIDQVAHEIKVEPEQISHLLNQAFGTQSSFKEEIQSYAKVGGTTLKSIIELIKEPLSEDTIESLRTHKAESLIETYGIMQGNISLCFAKKWTLEYEIALSGLGMMLAEAIHTIQYKGLTSTEREIKFEKYKQLLEELPLEERAYQIYRPLLKKNVSKATAAQYLAVILQKNSVEAKRSLLEDGTLSYLRDAIYHVTGGAPRDANQ